MLQVCFFAASVFVISCQYLGAMDNGQLAGNVQSTDSTVKIPITTHDFAKQLKEQYPQLFNSNEVESPRGMVYFCREFCTERRRVCLIKIVFLAGAVGVVLSFGALVTFLVLDRVV